MRFSLGSLFLFVVLAGVDQPTRQPLAIHVESLGYPGLARDAEIQGTVDVEIEIDSQGTVSTASAVSGNPLLKQSAEKNISNWRLTRVLLIAGGSQSNTSSFWSLPKPTIDLSHATYSTCRRA